MKQDEFDLEAEIITLLNKEYELLTTASFQEFPNMMEKKERLVERLKGSESLVSDIKLQEIRALAERNSTLFSASLEGIGGAIERISDVRSSFGQLKTYNNQGRISTAATTAPRVSVKS